MPTDPFLLFFASWAAGKMLDQGLDVFSENVGEDLLNSLQSSPRSHDWNAELSPDQVSFLNTVRKTTPSRLKTFISKFRSRRKNAIVLLGPSGVGKTCVGIRLAGKIPDMVKATKTTPEIESFVPDLRAIDVYSPPGHSRHGDYLDTVTKLMTSRNPPKVILMIVCGGFHATATKDYTGKLDSPKYTRPGQKSPRPTNLQEFLSSCLKEEEDYLDDVYARISGNVRETIPWIITVVNKKDLWWRSKAKTMDRYVKETSDYGRKMLQLRGPSGLGAPDGTTIPHLVFPAYLADDGFGPSPSMSRTALRQAHMEADSMVLRALVFNKYTRAI